MNPVSKFYRNTTLIAGSHFSKYELLLLLWAIGAIFLLTRLFLRYIGEKRRIDRLSKQKNQAIQDLLDMLRKDKKIHIQVLCCPNLSTPCGIGLFRRQILLPSQEYTEEELFHILRHELQHFQTHDLLVKWMIRVFQCLFWWNPLVYLLGKDIVKGKNYELDLRLDQQDKKEDTMKRLLSMLLVVTLVALMATPAYAQVGQKEEAIDENVATTLAMLFVGSNLKDETSWNMKTDILDTVPLYNSENEI